MLCEKMVDAELADAVAREVLGWHTHDLCPNIWKQRHETHAAGTGYHKVHKEGLDGSVWRVCWECAGVVLKELDRRGLCYCVTNRGCTIKACTYAGESSTIISMDLLNEGDVPFQIFHCALYAIRGIRDHQLDGLAQRGTPWGLK